MWLEMRETSSSGSTPCLRMIETGMPWLSSKIAENRSAASIVCRPARLAWWSASLNTSFAAGETRMSRARERRHHVQLLFESLEDGMRVQLEIAHHLREEIPFHLGERQEDVFVAQHGVIAPARLLERAIEDSLC